MRFWFFVFEFGGGFRGFVRYGCILSVCGFVFECCCFVVKFGYFDICKDKFIFNFIGFLGGFRKVKDILGFDVFMVDFIVVEDFDGIYEIKYLIESLCNGLWCL